MMKKLSLTIGLSAIVTLIYFSNVSGSSDREEKTNERREYRRNPDWRAFKKIHQKNYKSLGSEAKAYFNWKDNFAHITAHNQRFRAGLETYTKGLSKLSDSSAHTILSYMTRNYASSRDEEIFETTIEDVAVPDHVDWRSVGDVVKAVRFQGHYSNGWLFSALAVLQSHVTLHTGYSTVMSPQEFLDCASHYGFTYGSIREPLSYVLFRGISSEKDYPSKPTVSKYCREYLRKPVKVGIKSIERLTAGDEGILKRAVATIGPIAVKIHATLNFVMYSSGVFYDKTCATTFIGQRINHAVLLVGYGTDPDVGDYWVIQNSWGVTWGEKGYMRLARNTLYNCGITSAAIYPVLSD